MNHHKPDHQGGHHAAEKPRRQFHKDWRVWIAVVLLLAAMGTYVLTNGEVLRFGAPPQQPAPTSTQP
jgi:hypothetical protein